MAVVEFRIKDLLKGKSMRSQYTLIGTIVLASLSGCGGSSEESAKLDVAQTEKSHKSVTNQYTRSEMCKGLVAAVTDQDPGKMHAAPQDDGRVSLTYDDESDRAVSYNDRPGQASSRFFCAMDGRRAHWSSDRGKWQHRSAAPTIKLSLSDDGELTVTQFYIDGTRSESGFSKAALSAD